MFKRWHDPTRDGPERDCDNNSGGSAVSSIAGRGSSTTASHGRDLLAVTRSLEVLLGMEVLPAVAVLLAMTLLSLTVVVLPA